MFFKSRLTATTAVLTILATNAFAADEPLSLGTITVTASPLGQNPDQFATIVDSVNREQILQQGGANLADALKDVPGVASTGFAAAASRPVIRGMDANRVKILEDGVSSSDVSDIGPDHGVPIDPLSAERIEVVRGAGALRYGSQAIGGVVNAINNRVPLEMPKSPISGEVNGSYGSNADTKQGAALLDGGVGQFAFHADGFARHADDYDTPLGVQQNSFSREDGFSLGSSYFLNDDSRAGLAVVHYDAKYGIPSDTTYIDMRQTKLLTNDSFAINAGPLEKITFQGGYADYKHTENEPDGTVDSTFLNKEWDGHLEAVFGKLGPLQSSALGVQVGNRSYSALGEDSSYLFPTLTQTYAGYAFTDIPIIDGLHLQAAGRIEQVTVNGTPASDIATTRNFTPVSGSAGLVWDAAQHLKFGLTLASTARAPAQTELFARGAHDGPETYETGDPHLKPERSNSIEGTVRAKLGTVSVEGSMWAAHFHNYIYGQLTGRTCDDDGNCVSDGSEDLKELNYAQRNARFWGGETKASVPIYTSDAGVLTAEALFDMVDATFSDGENVPRIQPWRVGGGLGWTSEPVDARIQVLKVGARDDVDINETPTSGYVELNLQIAVRPFVDHRNLEVAFVGHNLTDAVERNAVALNKDVVVMPGRDLRVVLRERF